MLSAGLHPGTAGDSHTGGQRAGEPGGPVRLRPGPMRRGAGRSGSRRARAMSHATPDLHGGTMSSAGTLAPRRANRTVGVEEEFLLVDPGTGRAVPRGPAVAAAALALDHRDPIADEPGLIMSFDTELQQEQLETATPPRTSMAPLAADLRALRRAADTCARAVGARVAALATHPFPVTPVLTSSARYLAIREQM